jgi:hypothetical protein
MLSIGTPRVAPVRSYGLALIAFGPSHLLVNLEAMLNFETSPFIFS